MSDADIEKELNELLNEVAVKQSPQNDKLAFLTRQTVDYHKQLKKSVNRLQDSLDYLKLIFKYQVFDLEATRRENKQLRKLLEDKNN